MLFSFFQASSPFCQQSGGHLQKERENKFKKKNPLNNAWTDWIFLDPDRVDLIVQHKLREMDILKFWNVFFEISEFRYFRVS